MTSILGTIGLATLFALGGCTTGEVGRSSTFDITQASPEDVARALDRDGRVTLRGVLFESDSARLSDDGRLAAQRLAAAMDRSPALRVAIVGHTDATGTFRHNLDLSERRAEAIGNALTRQHGIAEDRIAPVGVGSLAPAATNDTPEGRAMNRRVEVVAFR
jgi:outer membrane protein OmpA-like peptidoglycan-associated protein